MEKERVIVPKIEDYFLFETTLTITSLTKEFALKLFVDSDTQEGYEFRISLINNQLTFGKTRTILGLKCLIRAATTTIFGNRQRI